MNIKERRILMIECVIKVSPSFDVSSAALLVQEASRFRSYVSLVLGEKTANAKSIMGIISLSINNDDTVKIIANGEDEEEALHVIMNFLGEKK